MLFDFRIRMLWLVLVSWLLSVRFINLFLMRSMLVLRSELVLILLVCSFMVVVLLYYEMGFLGVVSFLLEVFF